MPGNKTAQNSQLIETMSETTNIPSACALKRMLLTGLGPGRVYTKQLGTTGKPPTCSTMTVGQGYKIF